MALSDAIATVIRLACGVSPRTLPSGRRDAQQIFYANHVSNLDFPIIWSSLPRDIRRRTRPVAALDYWTKNSTRQFLSTTVFKAILIDRSGDIPAEHKTKVISDGLRAGASIIIFPEGSRSETGELRPFKSGIYYLTREHPEVEVVPVFLENIGRILPKGESLPVPLLTSVTFGTPIERVEEEGKADFLARAHRALVTLSES